MMEKDKVPDEEPNKVLAAYLETQIKAMQESSALLARCVWLYYTALKEQGFGDLQATELCKSYQALLTRPRDE